MDEEAGFLSAIHQTPAEDTTRLAYADWLGERDDPRYAPKAEFVRLELRLAHAPDDDPVHHDGPPRLRGLAATLPLDWLAVLSRPPLEGCRMRLLRPCPGRWDRLFPLGSPTLRFCDRCERTVNFCGTLEDGRQRVRRGECVAMSPAVERRPNDLGAPRPWNSSFAAVTPEMIETIRDADRRGDLPPQVVTILDRPRFARRTTYGVRSQPAPRPDPEPHADDASPPPKRRTGGRGRQRNIQRRDWEDE